MKPRLLVYQDTDGEICCHREGDTGMFIVGRGATVVEAVGDWCIYSGKVEAVCNPPELLEERFCIHPTINRSKRSYKPADKRG